MAAYGPGYLPLKEAYEIVVQYRPAPDGRLQVSVADLPVFPHESAAQIIVRADMVVDASGDEGLARIHGKMTGRPSLFLPGTSKPRG